LRFTIGKVIFKTLYPQFKANHVANVTEPDFVDAFGTLFSVRNDYVFWYIYVCWYFYFLCV